MKYLKSEKQEALEKLKSWIKKGDILHTTVRHVSRSGMMRHISVRHLKATDNPERPVNVSNYDYHVARVLDLPEAPNYQGVKIGGCGMDMGFHLVYSLSRALFKDEPKGEGDRDHGYWINQEWL
jgi:hypothetical protein